MSLLFGSVFWVLFAFTFFMIVNQLMYQEHSILHEWYKSAPGFHVLWIMMVLGAIVVSISLAWMHHLRDGVAVILLAVAWVIFFLMYNRMIEVDVQNKITAGDLPPSRDGWLDDTHVKVVINNDKYKDAKAEDRLNGYKLHDFPDSYPTA